MVFKSLYAINVVFPLAKTYLLLRKNYLVPIDSKGTKEEKPYKDKSYSSLKLVVLFWLSVTHPLDLFMISSTLYVQHHQKIEPTPFPQHVIIEDNLGSYITL